MTLVKMPGPRTFTDVRTYVCTSTSADKCLCQGLVCVWTYRHTSARHMLMSRFRDHESSLAHRDACAAFIASKSTPVNEIILANLKENQLQQRSSLMKQLAVLRFLLQQGLFIRNDHAGGSNLSVMLESVLGENLWVHDSKYQSPEIINEILSSIKYFDPYYLEEA